MTYRRFMDKKASIEETNLYPLTFAIRTYVGDRPNPYALGRTLCDRGEEAFCWLYLNMDFETHPADNALLIFLKDEKAAALFKLFWL